MIKTILKNLILSAAALLCMAGFIQPVYAQELSPTAQKAAASSSFDVFIDSNNDVCIVTNDQKKTSNIYYKTIGFTIAEGQFDPSAKKLKNGAATPWFKKTIHTETVETYAVNGREINCFRYPFAEIRAAIAGVSGEWDMEIEQALHYGKTAYIRFDCIMWVMNDSRWANYYFHNDPEVGPYDDEARDLNPKEIQGAEPWRAGSRTGLRTHFHRWLPIGAKAPISIVKPWLDHRVTKQSAVGPGSTYSGTMTYAGDYSGAPDFAGGNANLEGYDASLGIPSTKSVTAYAEASPWHGNLDVWARMVTKQFNIRHLYRWEPVPLKGEDGEDSLDNAIKELQEAEDKDKNDIKSLMDGEHPVGEKVHDTPLEHVFHHFVEVTWVDDADNILCPCAGARGTDGEGKTHIGTQNPSNPAEGKGSNVPESSDHTYDPKRPSVPTWWYGWFWQTKEKDSNGNDVIVSHTMTWSDHTNPKPAPTGSNIVYGPVKMWKSGTVKHTDYKLTCIVNREYWDERYKGTEDGFIQVYAAFEFIDPYKSKFYDLGSVTMYNDTYESMSFAQTIDTYMDSGKANIKTKKLVDFTEWMQRPDSGGTGQATAITPADILTSDYLIWSKQKSQIYKGGTSHPGQMKTYTDNVTELERKINNETNTMNDYIQVKNPVDKGPADGIYLGNKTRKWMISDRDASAGVVKGCDFRDGKWMGYNSLGTNNKLIGTEHLLQENEINTNQGEDKSLYWYMCTHSAGGNVAQANAYVTNNQAKLAGKNKAWEKLGYNTSSIEPKIANGAHESDISVTYVHEMVGYALTTRTMQFAKVLNGHLYSDTIGSSGSPQGQSYWGGCMGSTEGPMEADFNEVTGYVPPTINVTDMVDPPGTEPNVNSNYADDVSYIVDPVQIHTPVMSPGVIEDKTGQISKDHHEGDTSTQLVHDNSTNTGTSQMRLDQHYYIKWQDLSEIGEKHRDAPTSAVNEGETGGYWTETDDSGSAGLEEDEFTKNKYMKFPFEVFYNGKFYKANQWILIRNPNKYDKNGNAKDDDDGYLRGAHKTTAADGSFKSENHWLYTPIYIPTWAHEGLYEEIDNPDPHDPQDLTTCAQLKVDAINVTHREEDTGRMRNSADQIQELANTYYNISSSTYDDGGAYVAQFNIPVQLSGWIYGFTVTGTSDKDIFGYQTPDEITTSRVTQNYDYSFTKNKQDKRSGLFNRLGFPSVRFLKDGLIARNGSVAEWDPINTIALVGAWKDGSGGIHYGKSNYWKYMGTVTKGNIFSFTLKTISNMWNFNDKDSIRITPTFKYQKFDMATGNWIFREHKDLKVYYTDNGKSFMPYGSDKDLGNVQQVVLGSEQFAESYYDDEDTKTTGSDIRTFGNWLEYNVYQYNKKHKLLANDAMSYGDFKNALRTNVNSIGSNAITAQMWLMQKINVYCMSKIDIPERLRLLSGEPDQLKINNYEQGYDVTDSNFKTYKDLAGSNYGEEFASHFNSKNELKTDGETPLITYKYTAGGSENEARDEEISMDDKFRSSIQSWYSQYYVPSDLYVVDLQQHPEFRDFSDPASPFHHYYEANGGMVYGDQLGSPGDHNPYWDYLEYYATTDYRDHDGLTEDEDIFLPDGFLTVNFDITAVKDGEDHLIYKGNYSDGWKTENYQDIPGNLDKLTDPGYPGDIRDPEPGLTEDGVPTEKGDVVVVDLSKKFGDRFRAGIFNIN